MSGDPRQSRISGHLAELHSRFREQNPKSAAAQQAARGVLPGGNTRSVLYYQPFPLTMAQGRGARLRDIDGHEYLDCVGEFSAGLYGHDEPEILGAIREVLNRGLVLAAPTDLEARMAALLQQRFPSLERLRFCNSGTEANLFAIATAIAVTGRRKVMVFRHAYHGGVLVFGDASLPMNVPHDFVMADYNDAEGARRIIEEQGGELAAVIVEPVLGAGGNIPGTPGFLKALREATQRTGTILIFDEVKTSRCGPGGVQQLMGIRPDLTTMGKYVGGGLPCGVFGGRADLMDRFDPARPDALKHAGTFNNNVCTLAAGLAGLSRVFTPERAADFFSRSEDFRLSMNREFRERNLPMQCVGLGSMFSLHFTADPVNAPADIPAHSRLLGQLFHMHSLLKGVLVCARGDLFLSLPMTDADLQKVREVMLDFAASYPDVLTAG